MATPGPDGVIDCSEASAALVRYAALTAGRKRPEGASDGRSLAGSKSAAFHRWQPEASTPVTGGFAEKPLKSGEYIPKAHYDVMNLLLYICRLQ